VARAAYVCQIGCMAECRHHHACVVYMVDKAHPHPSKKGREQHFAMAPDGMMHEWNGAAGKCSVYDPAVEEAEQTEPIVLTVRSGP
jgi:hypothetical protein